MTNLDVARRSPDFLRRLIAEAGDSAKAGKPALEDALVRGLKRCRGTGGKFERATIRYQDPEGTEPKNLMLILELDDGRVCLFTGGVDADGDQFVVVEVDQLSVLDDALSRAIRKRGK